MSDDETILPADHAAIVFTPDGKVSLLIPDGEPDDELPDHVAAAAAIFISIPLRSSYPSQGASHDRHRRAPQRR